MAITGQGTKFYRGETIAGLEQIGHIKSFNGMSKNKNTIEVLGLSAPGYKKYKGSGKKDNGILSIEAYFILENYLDFSQDFEDKQPRYYQLQLPDSTTFTFEGLVISLQVTNSLSSVITVKVDIKISGKIISPPLSLSDTQTVNFDQSIIDPSSTIYAVNIKFQDFTIPSGNAEGTWGMYGTLLGSTVGRSKGTLTIDESGNLMFFFETQAGGGLVMGFIVLSSDAIDFSSGVYELMFVLNTITTTASIFVNGVLYVTKTWESLDNGATNFSMLTNTNYYDMAASASLYNMQVWNLSDYSGPFTQEDIKEQTPIHSYDFTNKVLEIGTVIPDEVGSLNGVVAGA